MLTVYYPFLSIGANANPRSCVGDSVYEWVVNNTSNTLTRINKATYVVTDTISLPGTNYTNIVSGIYEGNSYIFTAAGAAGNDGNIIRVRSFDRDDLLRIKVRNDGPGTTISGNVIAYSNGYLWLVPNNVTDTIIRLNIFDEIAKTDYLYNTITPQCDPQVTVYTGVTGTVNASYAYIFGNFIYTLANNLSLPFTVICKMSTTLAGASGIIQSPAFNSYIYRDMYISQLASDNVNYLWMSENSNSERQCIIYRMPLSYIGSVNQPIPTIGTGVDSSFSSTLQNVSAMKYGAGYLWIAGNTFSGDAPSLVQVDVTTNTIMNTIPLFRSPLPRSTITSIDIYNEYLWMTDNTNRALLKMKIYLPCFKEGTKILCLTPQMKEEYVPIQNIRKGHLVKTSLNGFVPVCMIGYSGICNPGGDERIKNRLYKCSKGKYPELFEDLYITGCHSILVNNLSESQREKTLDALGDVFITDRKYRLMAYLDERSEPYSESGRYTIWHLALEHNDYYMNYGIYANGLLVESTSKRYMKELSSMKLID